MVLMRALVSGYKTVYVVWTKSKFYRPNGQIILLRVDICVHYTQTFCCYLTQYKISLYYKYQ